MAQIVAKAMAKGADCDKLAAEFADELDTLGVRVAKLEKGADAVKITGNIRYHYTQNDGDANGYATKLRSRIFINGQINDDWKYTGMLENDNNLKDDKGTEDITFQRAYLDGKIGGLKVTAGRWSNLVAEGNIWDSRMDAVKAVYGKDIKATVVVGKADASTPKQNYGEYASYELAGKVGVVALNAGFYDFSDPVDKAGDPRTAADKEIWAVNAAMPLAKDLKLGAMWLKGDAEANADEDGYVFTLAYKGAKASKPGSWGLTAKYYDQPEATYADHTMNGFADSFYTDAAFAGSDGFKGIGLFANYALAKNIVAQVEYYDLEAREINKDVETLWTQVVFTF
ncbi:MAG: hypothetical protein IJA40_04265, partial [Phascolarctobacterium sp.]|nr:hypothetical protein [Phascolarctobacterium sp.]